MWLHIEYTYVIINNQIGGKNTFMLKCVYFSKEVFF